MTPGPYAIFAMGVAVGFLMAVVIVVTALFGRVD